MNNIRTYEEFLWKKKDTSDKSILLIDIKPISSDNNGLERYGIYVMKKKNFTPGNYIVAYIGDLKRIGGKLIHSADLDTSSQIVGELVNKNTSDLRSPTPEEMITLNRDLDIKYSSSGNVSFRERLKKERNTEL